MLESRELIVRLLGDEMKAFFICLYMLALPGLNVKVLAGSAKTRILTARGTVFNDLDRDGVMNSAEPGIEAVLVSNGLDIVQTKKDGSYEIELGQTGTLFVIKPRGFMTAIGKNNLPHFYYLHSEKGGTSKIYSGLDPTGPLPERINFPLYPEPINEKFTVLLFGDSQTKTQTHVDYLSRDVIDELVGVEGVAFGVSLGDIVDDDLSLFGSVNQVIARIGVPWYNVIGNHDMNYDVPNDEQANQTFEANYGPSTYSFNYGKVHFIILDDIVYKGYNPTPSGYVGGFTHRQLKFIENDLKHVSKDTLVVLMMHIPLFLEDWSDQSFRVADRQALFDLLAPFPHTFSISAHTHIQRQVFFGEEDGWHGEEKHYHFNSGTACGSWWSGELDEFGLPHTTMRDGTPNGYAFLRFDGNQFVIDFKAARRSEDFQMSVYAPRAVRSGEYPTGCLYVNFFMGNERTEVMSRIDFEREWKPMRKTRWMDPYMNLLTARYDTAQHALPGSRLSPPSYCYHLWMQTVPTNLPVGLHSVDIKVIDMWGREFNSSTSFRME
ncbi:MAG: metallophosphoesterase [Acidobacteria bacterium]|nr:MAG: metallophosphoesterase [Acidobacteriota bacterium]